MIYPPQEKSMSTSTPHNFLRPLLASVIFLGCLGTLFLMYGNSSIQWLYDPVKTAVCSNQETGIPTIDSNNVTTLLVWLLPFGSKTDLSVCRSLFNIEGCFLTTDRSLYSKADGVLIHHRDIAPDLSNLPKLQRPSFQKWIWMNMESPSNSAKLPGIANLFNLTLSYRLDSGISVPSGSLLTVDTEDFVLPKKTNLVCWIVSNWNENHVRAKYYKEMSKYAPIQVFGQAFGRPIPNDQYSSTMSSCRFYLAFENSIHKDYITEKLFNPLSLGTVPVVLGPSRQNYENLIPGSSFIHVNDFKSPRELVEYLNVLEKNETKYLRYFEWRKDFMVKRPHFWIEHACRACEHLKRHKQYEAFHGLDKWYWN
ncbi:Alpha-(1,3)-fucosyltransferase 9 [Oryzias melastigma]|uniref:Fucosyltransferase n=1 Tax=Oryzias melastigma TaxID=30732 RepID=A0A834CHT1_ORYME|nr:Alpha-(1,3)-fucosyltransferase 9 [Oryzias melastigma]